MKPTSSRIFAACLLLLACASQYAARGQSRQPSARKFDEFTTDRDGALNHRWGDAEAGRKELTARLRLYAAQLRKEGARPYAITSSPRVVEWYHSDRSVASSNASGLDAAQDGRARDCALLTPSRKFDEYGVVSDADEMSRLERLVGARKAEDQDVKAFIIGYAGRTGRAGEGLARADRAKKLLTDKSVFYNMRFNTLDCGRRETPSTELWITPVGASPPRCSPTLDPTPAPAKGATPRPSPRRRSGRL